MSRRAKLLLLLVPVAVLVIAAIPVALRRPSNTRAWIPMHARAPAIVMRSDSVWIRNVRDFRWRSDSSDVPGWEDRAYDLGRLQRMYFVLSPFARAWRGPAHTFVSFEFDDGSTVAVSVEARREPGEAYGPWAGATRHFELLYVIGEERDLIGLRAIAWGDPVYLYPVRATPDQARRLFVRLLRGAHGLEDHPAFYNTLTSNCTTNIVDAVNDVFPHRIRASYRILLPGYSDALARDLGLLDTRLPLAEARRRFQVNARARAAIDAPAREFSRRIRAN
jgi:hypothetical protein